MPIKNCVRAATAIAAAADDDDMIWFQGAELGWTDQHNFIIIVQLIVFRMRKENTNQYLFVLLCSVPFRSVLLHFNIIVFC